MHQRGRYPPGPHPRGQIPFCKSQLFKQYSQLRLVAFKGRLSQILLERLQEDRLIGLQRLLEQGQLPKPKGKRPRVPRANVLSLSCQHLLKPVHIPHLQTSFFFLFTG